jgi:hypothetical protein
MAVGVRGGIRSAISLVPVLVAACGSPEWWGWRPPAEEDVPPSPPSACNGSAELCDRPYDRVAFGTTHNAMSSADEGWFPANQRHNVARQLDDGVRALMLDLHYSPLDSLDPFADAPLPFLCHAVCIPGVGESPLEDTLALIRIFLKAHPHEVLTIIFESYVDPPDVERAFAKAHLLQLLHAQPPDAPWPTLREMIARGQRVVVFTDRGGGAFDWYHDVWAHAWDTRWRVASPGLFDCEPDRGSPENRLFILNHFLTSIRGPGEQLAWQANFNPTFIDHALRCRQSSGRTPNFLTVDYYDEGDLFLVLDALNRAAP